jgi:5-methylcytosine-specific restriction endonuclease McrA
MKAARLASLAEWIKTPAGKEQRRVSRQECYQRRRAQKAGVYSEKFHHVEVYERDGWICGLCGVPVDQDRRYPDISSASLDHIVPLSYGGPHTRDNTQLAHLGCNLTKGASTSGLEVIPRVRVAFNAA